MSYAEWLLSSLRTSMDKADLHTLQRHLDYVEEFPILSARLEELEGGCVKLKMARTCFNDTVIPAGTHFAVETHFAGQLICRLNSSIYSLRPDWVEIVDKKTIARAF